ncbi:conserved hypothetical protein [Ricinus communis]|uniref:Uncharacterized protein n=1 Tax=Ricinus communis TaxID=3988 RepID=B9T2X6_RICCO|nr:conserved hypothetical protein [Ricinus communis]
MEATNENSTVIVCEKLDVAKPLNFLSVFFQFLYEAGCDSNQFVARGRGGVMESLNHIMLLSLPLLRVWLMSLVSILVRRLVFKSVMTRVLEAVGDLLLRNYSVIIPDKVHERSVNTDLLIGMLSHSINLRQRIEIVEYTGQASERSCQPIRGCQKGAYLSLSRGRALVPEIENMGNNEISVTSELHSIEGTNMKDVNEASEIGGNSADQLTDRFSY